MKKELINKLFTEFIKDKEIITQNLEQVMNLIILEASNKNEKITMTIKYERSDKIGKIS